MNPANERRQFWRALFHAPARLISEGRRWPVEVIDLSLKGALVEFPAGFTATRGQSAELRLNLSDEIELKMQMRVAHVEDGRAGLRCEHIDVDSMIHLRRLVELNSGDPAQLERELALLCG